MERDYHAAQKRPYHGVTQTINLQRVQLVVQLVQV